MKRRNPTLRFLVFLTTLIGVLSLVTWANYQYVIANPGGNDFLIHWMGASRWRTDGVSPYDDTLRAEAETLIYGREAAISLDEPRSYFLYPFYSMIFYAPMGLLSFELARAAWMTLMAFSAIGSLFMGLRVVDWRPPWWVTGFLMLFSVGWYYAARTLIVGQISLLIGFLLIWAIYLTKEKHDAGAGILFALATIKPTMGILVILFSLIWTLSKKRHTLLISFIVSWLILIGVSLLFLPNWIIPMGQQWVAIWGYADLRAPIELIAGAIPAMESTLGRVLQISLLLYLAIEWFFALGKNERWFVWGALLTMTISQLVVFRLASTNNVVLLFSLLLIFQIFSQRWKSIGHVATVLVSGGVVAGLWGLFLMTTKKGVEADVMFLIFPLVCLVLLWWARWWALRASHLGLEIFASKMNE